MPAQISRTSTVVAEKGRIWCDLSGDAVILNVDNGLYYGLSPVGARIWQLIQEPNTVSSLISALLETYDVSAERCQADVFTLLHDLAANELIVIEAGDDGIDA